MKDRDTLPVCSWFSSSWPQVSSRQATFSAAASMTVAEHLPLQEELRTRSLPN